MFKNDFENIVYHEVLKSIVNKDHTFNINHDFYYYTTIRNLLDSANEIRLYINSPKRYGTNTHTEMVLVIGKKISFRIDCKNLLGRGDIQLNDIKGQIDKNIIENPLFEDKLIFVVGGNVISKQDKEKILDYAKLRNIDKYVDILTLSEFKFFINKIKRVMM